MKQAVDVSDEWYQCLSCSFRGVRDPRAGSPENSWMAHSIMENHLLGASLAPPSLSHCVFVLTPLLVAALLERKDQVYCSRCGDFVYPIASASAHAVVLRMRKKRPRVAPDALLALSAPRLMLRGLVNMGNTCFMNAVLQAFAHNRMLQDYFFVARTHDTVICQQRRRLRATESSRAPSVCLGCELAAFMGTLMPPLDGVVSHPGSATPVVPHGLLEAFWAVFPSFIGTEQHDAHEFLIALLGGLHSHTHPRVFIQGGLSPRFTPRGRSLCDCAVHQHFSGVLRSELECADCGTTSHKFDPFLDISLSLDGVVASDASPSSTGVISLDRLLQKFTADEQLQDVNQVYCPRCAKYRSATKRLRVRTLPNVLAFHIRRLDFFRQRKMSTFVQFPLVGLDMRKYLAGPVEGSESVNGNSIPSLVLDVNGSGSHDDPYDLVAVINHHGDSVDGGHYSTFVMDGHGSRLARPESPKDWFLLDDVHVSSVSGDQVRESQAYVG
jgi:ubiquitin carboxyl-terminal hydrolase 22/27/51